MGKAHAFLFYGYTISWVDSIRHETGDFSNIGGMLKGHQNL